jgi:hypothetical protein
MLVSEGFVSKNLSDAILRPRALHRSRVAFYAKRDVPRHRRNCGDGYTCDELHRSDHPRTRTL